MQQTSFKRASAIGCALSFIRPSTLCRYSALFHRGVLAQAWNKFGSSKPSFSRAFSFVDGEQSDARQRIKITFWAFLAASKTLSTSFCEHAAEMIDTNQVGRKSQSWQGAGRCRLFIAQLSLNKCCSADDCSLCPGHTHKRLSGMTARNDAQP